jgi:hypothetical protein
MIILILIINRFNFKSNFIYSLSDPYNVLIYLIISFLSNIIENYIFSLFLYFI